MNDRCLFRAKRIDNGEWVKGHYITDEKDPNHAYIGYFIGVVDGVVHDTDVVEIISSTICQCTGLKDKNGNLIYENDIVTGRFGNEIITGCIRYGSNAQFYIDRKGMYGIYLDNSQDWLDVIGNIFDNKELLEQEG